MKRIVSPIYFNNIHTNAINTLKVLQKVQKNMSQNISQSNLLLQPFVKNYCLINFSYYF